MSSHNPHRRFTNVENDGSYLDTLSTYADGELLEKILSIVKKEKLYGKYEEYKKVVDFRHPAELCKILELNMARGGCRTRGEVDEILERVVRHSVRTQHPHFYNQLYGSVDEVGLASAWLLEAMNTNAHTFEVGPAMVIAERTVVAQLVKIFGWEEGDGIFTPGGSISNMYSIIMARHQRFPELKRTGLMGSKPLVLYTSDQCHYSILKAASWLGFGLENCVSVVSNHRGVMTKQGLQDAVAKSKAEGKLPFYVNATAGTTIFGAFDDFDGVADVCKEEGMWMHTDACWGGAAAFSSKHRHLLEGVSRSDSIAWNPHKMICIPHQCSVVMTKHKELLQDSNCSGATYLFQQDKFYDTSFDTGDKSIQCGRKGDALKLWLTFKIHGLDVIERRIDAAFEASKHLEAEIRKRPGFELVRENLPCTNVCFWYVPAVLQNMERTVEWWQMLNKVCPIIKGRMVLEGTLMVGYQPMPAKSIVNFFRMVNCCYPVPSPAHMNFVLDEIERRGKVLKQEQLMPEETIVDEVESELANNA